MQSQLLSSTSSDVVAPNIVGRGIAPHTAPDTAPRIARIGVHGLVALAVFALAACDRGSPASGGDSAAGGTTSGITDSIATIVTASGWDAETGPFVVLPTVDGGMSSGSLLRPEATELTVGDTVGVGRVTADGRLDLFSRSGKVGSARLTVQGAPVVEPGCTAWPVARLAEQTGSTAPSPGGAPGLASGSSPSWTAAFAAGRITAIPLDSIEGLAPRDSARLAADLTRLASALPDDTSRTFRGLPFVVLRAYRARTTDASKDTAFVVATLARRVNQEDDPKEERLVMVVDVSGDDVRNWKVAWHERAAGHEEELVVAEPLLAYRPVSSREVHLLFGRDDGIALGAAVLARGPRGWRVQWESAVAGCD